MYLFHSNIYSLLASYATIQIQNQTLPIPAASNTNTIHPN